MKQNLLKTVFNGLALAMGVAVIVLNTLGTLAPAAAFTLMGFGLSALAVVGLQKE